ncbi:hypothetical protein BG003_007544 [Podila horticola]|nr:hypothetical protein BG003_007544 [Podila horticola]
MKISDTRYYGSEASIGSPSVRRTRLILRGLVALAAVWLLCEFSTLHKASLSSIPTPETETDHANPIVLVEPVVITKSTISRAKTRPEPFYFPPMSETEKPITKEVTTSQEPSGPKMIDVILFNTELDQLDIRLHELFPVVDTFVIIESKSTFSSLPKPLFYKENEQRFEKFKSKIHYIELPPMPTDMEAEGYAKAWGIEAYTRSKGLDMAIRKLQPHEGDWILLSDLDEIPRPSILQAMKTPDPESEVDSLFLDRPIAEGPSWDLFRLACRFYYYSFEFYNDFWNGPVLLRYRERESHDTRMAHGFGGPEYDEQKRVLSMIGDNQWRDAGYYMREHRNSDAATLVEDACWHCSWCFDKMESYVDKMKSYSHTEHNNPQYQTQEWIIDHVNRGVDLFDRDWVSYKYLENNFDMPGYIRRNKNKFLFMLDRYGKQDARFIDVDESLLPSLSPPAEENQDENREESQEANSAEEPSQKHFAVEEEEQDQ